VPREYDPVAYGKIFRQLEKGRFSLARQPHFGLGLPGYTQLTSPIRRLGDLVIQQQVSAQLAGRKLPFEQNELLEILTQAELGEKEVRSAERQANRFYALQFLQENLSGGSTAGVVLDKLYNGYLVELCDFFIRGRLACPAPLKPGDRVNVAIDRIDPRKNVLVFALA
jgi:exoribonuclease-2